MTIPLHLYFLSWRDGLEILCFSVLFYYLALWLKKDKTKNLLPYFYGYCLLALTAHVLHLPTVTYFLFLFAPAAVMLFVLMHQDTLQRNIIALKNIAVPQTHHDNWCETLLRTCLIALNNNKEMLCVIEHTDSLQPFIITPFIINAPLNQSLLELLLASPSYEQQQMIWLNSKGTVLGINATWQHVQPLQQTFVSSELSWRDDALHYSAKTDALLLHASPATRTFTIAVSGTLLQKLSVHHANQIIKKHLSQLKQNDKGMTYETSHKNNNAQQRSP